ncbi:transposase [Bradyrhizobium sp. AUGA SZCCT0160]|nr:transposase [Bradyrhizobium sp. AUGA SZCCT0160]
MSGTWISDGSVQPLKIVPFGGCGWHFSDMAVVTDDVRLQVQIGLRGSWLLTSENDPGCVKTSLLCYDSLVILRGKLMRRFVEQADRGQWTLLPECDDFIDESNPVRVIDVFVDTLDLAEMNFEGVEPAATGRPSYHPSVLLKLYIYGYLNAVEPAARARGRPQCRSHVAIGPARS